MNVRIHPRWMWISILNAGLVLVASILGIFNPATYAQESDNWALQAIGQDIGNILAVVIFLVSLYFLRRHSRNASFIWLGSLLYFMYAYLVYSFAVHFNYLFLIYVSVLGLSTYTFLGGIIDMSGMSFQKPVRKRNERFASIVLLGTGILFLFLWLSDIIPALLSGQIPPSTATAGLWVNPIHVIDLAFVLPAFIITGILLWKGRPLGYFFVIPWLIFSILMGSSIVATMILELRNNNMAAIPPLVMVGSIVLASIIALFRYLQKR